MLHLLKYRFIQTVRDYPIMFWALAFPLILGTFFLSLIHISEPTRPY